MRVGSGDGMGERDGRRPDLGGWFTVERLDAGTYAVSEYRHWEETHCYLLLASRNAVLIDTGLGVGDIRQAVEELTSLPVAVLTTHAHWDHIGGHARFDDIAVHEAEAGWLEGGFPLSRDAVLANLLRRPCRFPDDFRPEDYRIFQGRPRRLLHDGQLLDFGDRRLTVLHTPGHSPGHCCFYEPERGYLFSGDLIYAGCLDAFYPSTDPLLFRQSVQRVGELAVNRLFPGHHRLDVPVSLIGDVANGFCRLAESGELEQGSGVFDFGMFQIHL